jgi:hypothetical protein
MRPARQAPKTPMRSHRWPIVTVIAAALLLGGAVPATAEARKFGKWRVSVKASIGHDWEITSTQPCDDNGPGSVTAGMKGRSKPFSMAYFARGGYKYWDLGSGAIRLKGEVTAVDNRTRNPTEWSESCGKIDKSGCVTRPPDRSTAGYVDGMNTRGKAGVTFDVANLMLSLGELPRPCEFGDLYDFSDFPGAPGKENGGLIAKMPRASKVGRHAFTVTARNVGSARGEELEPTWTTQTRRKVRLRFKPKS